MPCTRRTPTDSPSTREQATPINLSASLPASFASRSQHQDARGESQSGWDEDAFPISRSSPMSKWTLGRSKRLNLTPTAESVVQVPFQTSHSLPERQRQDGDIHRFGSTPAKSGERPSTPLFIATRDSITKQKTPHYQLARLSREAHAQSSTPLPTATVPEEASHNTQQQTTPRKKLQRRRSRANSLALFFSPTSRKDACSSSSSSLSDAFSNAANEKVEPPYTPSRKAVDESRSLSNTAESKERRYDELHHLISLIEGSSAGGQYSPRAFPVPTADGIQIRKEMASPGMSTASGRRRVGGQHLVPSEPQTGKIEGPRSAEVRERGRSGSLLFGLFGSGSGSGSSLRPPHPLMNERNDMDEIDFHLDTPSKMRTLRTRASMPFLSLKSAFTAPLYAREDHASKSETSTGIDNIERNVSEQREGWFDDPLRLSLGIESMGTTFHEQRWAEYAFPPLSPVEKDPFVARYSLQYRLIERNRQEEQFLPAYLTAVVGDGARTSTPPLLLKKTVFSKSVGASHNPPAQLYPSDRPRSRHATVETFLSSSSSPSSEAEVTLRPLSSLSSLVEPSQMVGEGREESTFMFDPETSDGRLIRELIDAFPSPRASETTESEADRVERSPASMLTFDDEAMSPAMEDDGVDLRMPDNQGHEVFQHQAGVVPFEPILASYEEEEEAAASSAFLVERQKATSNVNAGISPREAHRPSDKEPKLAFAPSSARKLLRQLSLRRRPSYGALIPSSLLRRRNSSLTTQGSLSTIASSGGRESLAFSGSDGPGGWRDDYDEEECSTPFYLEDDQVYWPQILEH